MASTLDQFEAESGLQSPHRVPCSDSRGVQRIFDGRCDLNATMPSNFQMIFPLQSRTLYFGGIDQETNTVFFCSLRTDH